MILTIFDRMGGDRTIAEAAWTSTISQKKKEEKSEEDVKRVVQMLIRDLHTSPLESAVMTFMYQDCDNDMILNEIREFKHVVIHHINHYEKIMITLNFHALMKYRKAHWIFEQMFQKVKEEGFLKYAIEQIELMENV